MQIKLSYSIAALRQQEAVYDSQKKHSHSIQTKCHVANQIFSFHVILALIMKAWAKYQFN